MSNLNTYFVARELHCNGGVYHKGETIELAEDMAEMLLADGVLSVDEIAVDVVDGPVVLSKDTTEDAGGATVGGEVLNSGEPSIDGETKTETKPEAEKPGILGRIFGGSKDEDKAPETTGTAVANTGAGDSAPTSNEPVKDLAQGM